MARSRSTDRNGYTNPDVRFERKDISTGDVLRLSLICLGAIVISVAAVALYGGYIMRQEQPRKVTDLPAAAVDQDRLPPEPRLESLEDLRMKNVKLFPPRAAEYLQAQEELLLKGDSARGIEPISQAMDALANRLPVRKDVEAGTAPTELPSKAASGRGSRRGK